MLLLFRFEFLHLFLSLLNSNPSFLEVTPKLLKFLLSFSKLSQFRIDRSLLHFNFFLHVLHQLRLLPLFLILLLSQDLKCL
ncbi:hypothetical protein LINPERPRIM_LOCUS29268, partial [Linum perenne]